MYKLLEHFNEVKNDGQKPCAFHNAGARIIRITFRCTSAVCFDPARLQRTVFPDANYKASLGLPTNSFNNLITVSMRNYYTEKIGELIVSARSELKAGWQSEAKLANLKLQMTELLSAYNVYADQKVTLNEIVPLELKSCWPGLEEARCDIVSSQ